MQAEFFALKGLTQLLKFIGLVNSRLAKNLKFIGMTMIMFNAPTRSEKEGFEDVRKPYSKKPLNAIIPRNVTVTDSAMAGSPAVKYRRNASASKFYM